MTRHAIAATLMVCALAGCAIRYGENGVSRTGILLWGLGDPPGVNWDLGAPPREIPELPAAPRRELPPREPAHAPRGLDDSKPIRNPPDKAIRAMNDNLDRVPSHTPESTAVSHPVRSDGRDDAAARR